MAWQTWVIGILIFLSWLQYTNPETGNKFLGSVFDPVNDFINAKGWMNSEDSDECPTLADLVCGDNGITYTNQCLATKAGVESITPGAC